MSLRFTDSRKWKEPWFRKLKPEEKLAFFYIWENCDNAGFIANDDQAVEFYTGIPADRLPKLWERLANTVVIKGEWMWIKDFPRLQKNWPLKLNNPAHKQIIRLLGEKGEHFKDCPEFTSVTASIKDLPCPLGIGVGNGNGSSLSIDRGHGASNGKGRGLGSGRELGENNQEPQACATSSFASNAHEEDSIPL